MPATRHELSRLLALAVPLLLGQLAIIGLGITDIVLTGRVSRDDLAGVMLGATLFDLPMMFIVGMYLANGTLVGRVQGRGSRDELNRQFQQSLWLSLPVGLVAALVVVGMRTLLLPVLDATPEVKAVAAGYLLPMTATAFLLPFVLALRTTLEAASFPAVAMVFNLGGFLINIPLDYALIHGIGPLPRLGGAGCGWATLAVLTGVVAGIAIYIHLAPTLSHLRVAGRLKPPEPRGMARLLRLGAPMGGAILAEAGFFHVIPMIVAGLGTLALAAHAVAMSFDMILFMIPLSLAQAITIRVAAAEGNGDGVLARRIVRLGLATGLVIAVLQSLALLALRHPVAALYTDDGAVATTAAGLLLVAAAVRIPDSLHICGTGALRGYGDTRATLVISVVAFWLAGTPLAMLAAGHPLPGMMPVQSVWLAILAAVTVASVFTVWRVRLVVTARSAVAES